MKLDGKNALVTGGARRIGRAISTALAERGVNVIIHYNRSREQAVETREEVESHGSEAHTVQADLSRPGDVENLFDATRNHLSPIQILVNNASVFDHTSFKRTTLEDWNRHQRINLTAPVRLMKQFSDQKQLKAGRIVNLLDWRAERPQARQFAYSVSKTGLAGATKAAARELAPDITVNGVAPGPILPPDGKSKEELDHIVEELPAGRWGDVEDVVSAVLFFARSSDFITGDVLHVDGGRHVS